jgi:hypothetical protein
MYKYIFKWVSYFEGNIQITSVCKQSTRENILTQEITYCNGIQMFITITTKPQNMTIN